MSRMASAAASATGSSGSSWVVERRRIIRTVLPLPPRRRDEFSVTAASYVHRWRATARPRQNGGVPVSGVRVLVGTRKGAFVLTSDGTRDEWEVAGPHFGGWEIYHVKGSPVDPDR